MSLPDPARLERPPRSPPCFGSWAVGRRLVLRLGPQDETRSTDAIHRAVDLGVNWVTRPQSTGSVTPRSGSGRAVSARG